MTSNASRIRSRFSSNRQLRNHDGRIVTDHDVHAAARYDAGDVGETEIAYKPARVVLQDFTGVPAVVDLAAMRSAVVRMTGDR